MSGFGHQVAHCPAFLIFGGGEHAARFVQGDVELCLEWFEGAAVQGDLVHRRIGLLAQHRRLAVDPHPPGRDEFLAGAARTVSGLRKQFLQALRSH